MNSARCSVDESQPSLCATSIILARTRGSSASRANSRYRARRLIACDFVQRRGHGRRLPLLRGERADVALDRVEKHPHFGHVPLKNLADECELPCRRQAVVREMARILPIRCQGFLVAHTASHGHGSRREEIEERRADAAAAELGGGARLDIAVENGCRCGSQRGLAGKAVDHRHVLEDGAHAIAVALRMQLVQLAHQTLGLGGRATGSREAAPDFGGCALPRAGVQRVAAEQVHLLQLREESRARVTARDALHLVDGQALARVEAVRVELAAVVEVAGDDQNVALNPLAARRCQPIGAAALHEFDELEIPGRKRAPQCLPLVGRVDGDGADGLGGGANVPGPRRREQYGDEGEARSCDQGAVGEVHIVGEYRTRVRSRCLAGSGEVRRVRQRTDARNAAR